MDTSPSLPPPEMGSRPEGWFEDLPEEHRERILADDAARLDEWERVQRATRRTWRKPCLQAAFLLAVISSYSNLFSWSAFATGFVSGAIAGLLWHRTRADRLNSCLIAVAMFFLGLIVTGQLTPLAVIWAPLPICCVSVFCGLRREELPGS